MAGRKKSCSYCGWYKSWRRGVRRAESKGWVRDKTLPAPPMMDAHTQHDAKCTPVYARGMQPARPPRFISAAPAYMRRLARSLSLSAARIYIIMWRRAAILRVIYRLPKRVQNACFFSHAHRHKFGRAATAASVVRRSPEDILYSCRERSAAAAHTHPE